MKKILLSFLTNFFFFIAIAQNTQPTITVKGTVIDTANNQALSYVTTALQDSKTQLSVRSTLSKEDGSFELTVPAGKSYQLVLVFVGYKSKTIAVNGTGVVINMDKVFLSASNKTLDAVSISAPKPLMKQEVDRLSYDVQADPESKTITALDMIHKVPLLSVDATDNIKLRGSGDYKILINGKESALMAKNPSDILKAMPASNIVKIEVITTPPAKYDAEGLAGIINIITTKNAAQGYNGSINGGYNSVYGYRANLNLSIKEGKLGYTGYAGSGNRPARSSDFENLSSFFNPVSALSQTGSRSNANTNKYAGNELSYEIDTLNLLTGTFNIYQGDNASNSSQFTSQTDANNLVNQSYHTQNKGTANYKGSDLGVNYQLGFKANKNELLTASYKFSKSDNTQNSDVTNDQRLNYTTPNYRQYNSSGSKEHTTQLDYIDPLKVLTIEAGGKMILRDNYSNSNYNMFNAATNQYVDNALQDNSFTYNQDVYSLYNSYQLKFTKWTVKGGLRLERTNVHADFTTPKSSFDQGYSNLVPSFSAQRTLNTTSSLTFGFTQRIQRPGIYQLNPFVDSSNNKYISTGNPNLRPAINNNFELSYGNFAKGSINISTHYSFVNNSIQNVVAVSANDVTTTTYANVGQNHNLGIDVNINYPLTKKMNLNINSELLQVWLKGTYNGSFYTNSGQQGHIFTYTDYKFDSGLHLGMNLGFDSRYVLLQGRDNWYFNNNYSASKEVLNKKGTISLSVANPFSKFNKLDFFTKTPDFETYNSNQNYYRSIYLGFNYKFGKLNSEIKKAQRGINNDDTSGGGRN